MPDDVREWQLRWEAAALRQLRKLPAGVAPRLIAMVESLLDNRLPAGVVKLVGHRHSNGEPLYHVRFGNYRIVYTIEDEKLLVLVVSVADRKEIYR